MKRISTPGVACAATLMFSAVLCACSGGAGAATTAPANTAATTPGMTSLQLSKQMSPGWNLGNALEAMPNETGWGNPAVNQAMFDALKAAGFKTVRLPVAWKQYADADDHISAAWMARVRQVVDYARKADLYVIVNVHWDGGWMQPTYARQPLANARLATFWTQIANAFKGYDEHLLFAGTNEVMVDGDYTAPKPEYCAVQSGFNQVFVKAVRATGGNNAQRHLVVQAFNTNIDHIATCNTTLPADTAANRLMMEVHYYDPFNFALNEKSRIWQWGKNATDPAAIEAWANEAYTDAQFQKMKTRFIDQGVPVILGEYGAILRNEVDPSGKYRTYWNQYITRSAYRHGLVPVYWDNGYASNHQMGLFNRATGAQAFPDVIRAIVNAAK
jgi:endoglucanase